MKTGYVYFVSVAIRFGRVLRLATSLRHPGERVRRLAAGVWRARRPRLVAFAFVEDLVGARAEVRAALKGLRAGGHARTFRCRARRARRALERAAERQAAFRRARFHPQTGLLVDRSVELAGPVAAFSQSIARVLASEAASVPAPLDLYLHPYLIGTIVGIFRERQNETKIPDEYLPEILGDIAWRVWRVRLKPQVFLRMAQRSRREASYMALAEARIRAFCRDRPAPAQTAAQPELVSFLRAPRRHLRAVVASYGDTLSRAPRTRLRLGLFRAGRFLALIAGLLALDALASGAGWGGFLTVLLVVFLTGLVTVAFNLYEPPDPTRGLGVFTAREIARELKALKALKGEPGAALRAA